MLSLVIAYNFARCSSELFVALLFFLSVSSLVRLAVILLDALGPSESTSRIRRILEPSIDGNARACHCLSRFQLLGVAGLALEIGVHGLLDLRVVNPTRPRVHFEGSVEDGLLSSFQDLLSFVVATICLLPRQGHVCASSQKISPFLTVQYLWEGRSVNGCNQLYTSLGNGFGSADLLFRRDFIDNDAVWGLVFDRLDHDLCLHIRSTNGHPSSFSNRSVWDQAISGDFARLVDHDRVDGFVLREYTRYFAQSCRFPNPWLTNNQERMTLVRKVIEKLRLSEK